MAARASQQPHRLSGGEPLRPFPVLIYKYDVWSYWIASSEEPCVRVRTIMKKETDEQVRQIFVEEQDHLIDLGTAFGIDPRVPGDKK